MTLQKRPESDRSYPYPAVDGLPGFATKWPLKLRAWCSHELRMSKRHVFLLPCQRTNTLLRFDGSFFLRLFNIIAERKLHPEFGVKSRAKAGDYLYRLFKSEYFQALREGMGLQPAAQEATFRQL
jgi:hypothetical protein